MKIKNVVTTVVETSGYAMVYEPETKKVESYGFRIQSTFKTKEGLETAVRKYFNDRELKLVEIEEYSKRKVTYSLDIETFMAYATPCEVEDVEQ